MGKITLLLSLFVSVTVQAKVIGPRESTFPKISTWQSTFTSGLLKNFSASELIARRGPSVGGSRLHQSVNPNYYSPFYRLDNYVGSGQRNLVTGYFKPTTRSNGKLIVFIPGTGGKYYDDATKFYAGIFADQGYKVITVDSPVTWEFIVSISKSGIIGDVKKDSLELYEYLKKLIPKYEETRNVDEVILAGFSLGAMNTAYISEYDSRSENPIFKKAVLINPPINLSYSMRVIESLKGKIARYPVKVLRALACYKKWKNRKLGLEDYFDSVLQDTLRRTCVDEKLIPMLVNYSMSSFVGDSARASYYVRGSTTRPRQKFTDQTFKNLSNFSFMDYLEQITLRRRGDREDAFRYLERFDLRDLASYFAGNPNIYLLHNMDDFIVNGRQILAMDEVFQERATIFPRGGHIGNAWHYEVRNTLFKYLERPVVPIETSR